MGFGQEFGQDQGDGSGRSHPPTLALSMTISDNHNRTAKLEATLTIVEISIAANAANCYIVAPGSTLTIKAVEGQFEDGTQFQQRRARMAGRSGHGEVRFSEQHRKVVVVQLNPGIAGNAVRRRQARRRDRLELACLGRRLRSDERSVRLDRQIDGYELYFHGPEPRVPKMPRNTMQVRSVCSTSGAARTRS